MLFYLFAENEHELKVIALHGQIASLWICKAGRGDWNRNTTASGRSAGKRADKAGQPPTMTSDWNYNPSKTGQRLLNKIDADKLNSAPPARAREAIKYDLNSADFKKKFREGDVRGWDLAVLPNDVAQALRKQGLEPPGQIVIDGIKPGKLQKKHPKVSVEQYQALQRALGQGGVYLQAPGKRRKNFALLAEYQDDNGQWWFYAINLENLRTKTIFDTGEKYRDRKFKQKEITVIRKWDRHQWEK